MSLFRKKKYLLPQINKKVGSLVTNDKLMVIVGAKEEEIRAVLFRFCKLYNRNEYKITIKLHPVEEKIISLTFPDDVDFVVFFYMVKNLNYSNAEKLAVKVIGWCTLPPIDISNPISEKAMIYANGNSLSEKSIYLTTQNNVCWKIDFDKNQYMPSSLVQQYAKPPYSFLEVKHREGYIL